MTVHVRLFARARDLAGTDRLAVDLAAGASVADLRRRLAEACPALRTLVERSAIALNDEFADDHLTVPLDADIALLPPVSGGQSLAQAAGPTT